jgi:hypothetical protein
VGLDVGATGGPNISFDTGAELQVTPHTKYESWCLAGEGITPIVVGPGSETEWTVSD